MPYYYYGVKRHILKRLQYVRSAKEQCGAANHGGGGELESIRRALKPYPPKIAAGRLKNNPRIVFLFIGGGHRTEELARRVKALGLGDGFRFMPYQENDVLKFSLSISDVHWISLRPELERLLVPSKFYGIAAAGRLVIAITAKTGEIAQLVETGNCGVVIEPGNSDALAETIVRLSTDAKTTAAMAARARAMLDAKFTRRCAFGRWSALLDRFE